MSYTTAGHPLQPTHHVTARPSQRPLMSTTLSGSPPGASPGTSCCQTGRPVMTDPMTGQTVCSCQLTPSLAAVSYPRLASLPESLYGSAAAYSAQALYAAAAASNGAADASSMYSPFGPMSPYELKDAAEVYRGLAQTPSGLLAYDPTAMFTYPFGAGYGGMDLSAARRNKNATRETTSTLKAWLYEHRKNPYPTKGEKIMLAIITKMTLTQVSTWFANARRRLKKDNKMTWTPKNGSGAESDNDDDDTNNNDNRDGDDKELDVGSTSDNANHDTDHRLDDSRDSIDIDTLSDKDPSESLRTNDGLDDASRLRTSTPDEGDHHQNSMDHHHQHHHPHHFSSSHPHLHHHHPANNTTTTDHHHSQQQQQQRTDHNKSPTTVHGGAGGGLGPRVHPYSTPVSSMAALQRTPGPYHLPYPTSMAHRMALPPGAMTSATELPGLRPSGHAFPSPSSSSFSSSTTTSSTRSTSPGEATTTPSSTSTTTKDSINNNTVKPKIWSLADIVTTSSSSHNSNSAPTITSSSSQQQVKTPPVRPSPGGVVPMPHASALGSLRAWTEATGGPYGLAAAMAAAQGLPHPYSRAPPHGVAGMPTMPGGFPGLPGGIPGGLSLMPHQNGFYPHRPADRLSVSDGFRSDSPTSSEDNKTAFKPVTKSKPAEVHV